MKLEIEKIEEEIKIYIIDEDGKHDFEYINFIERLYCDEEIEEIICPDDISEEEEKELKRMIDKINETKNELVESE